MAIRLFALLPRELQWRETRTATWSLHGEQECHQKDI
jgi:hypothetical protein